MICQISEHIVSALDKLGTFLKCVTWKNVQSLGKLKVLVSSVSGISHNEDFDFL